MELAFAVAGDGVFALAEAAGDGSHDRPEVGASIARTTADDRAVRSRSRAAVDGVRGGAVQGGVAEAIEGVEGLVVAVVVEAAERGRRPEPFLLRRRAAEVHVARVKAASLLAVRP